MLSVPQWAAECTVQAIPSLTIQYMSDSGTVELSRDCGEEGTRHMPCHGKEDRNTILSELTCIDDTDINDNSLKQSADQLGDIHQKSVELIKSVPSDNKEDNNINGVIDDGAKIESKSSDRLKLNLDDVMMGDQPIPTADEKVDSKPMSKTDKKPKKKADLEEKYLKKITKKKLEKDDSDELMMGDEPVKDDATVDAKTKEITLSPTLTILTTLSDATESIVSSTTILTTTETRLRRETEISLSESPSTDSSVSTTPLSTTTTNSLPVKIPIKVDIKTTPKPHISEGHVSTPHHQKENQEVHLSSDHFIPPMLLVRTQFSLSNGHGEHVEGPRRHIDDREVSTTSSNDLSTKIKTSPIIHPTTYETTTADATTVEVTTAAVTTATMISSTTQGITNSENVDVITTTINPISETLVTSINISSAKQDAVTATTVTSTTLAQNDQSTKLPTSPIPTEQVIELKKVTESTTTPNANAESQRFRQPHAPKQSLETHPIKTLSPTAILNIESSDSTTPDVITTSPSKQTTENVATERLESTTVTVTTSSPIVDTEISVHNNCSSNLDTSSDKPTEISKKGHDTVIKHHHSTNVHSDHNLNDHLAEATDNEDPCWTDESVGVDLSNSDVEQPFRPNRRRVLIKPETHSYIKKVLG